jgi:ribosome-associated translation inhibitor RaiA
MTEEKTRASFWDALGRFPGAMLRRQDEANERLKSIEGLLKKGMRQMAKGQEKLSQEIEELRTAVDAYTSAAATRVEEAVAAAREAWEADNEAAFNQAADALDQIASKLSSTQPIEPGEGEEPVDPFEPSGNQPAAKGKK